jgi:hypothetical protein
MGMTAYVLMCVAAGVIVAHAGTRLVFANRAAALELARRRAAFLVACPGVRDPGVRTAALTRELGKTTAALEAFAGAMRRRIDFPHVAAALAGALPPDARLMTLKIDGKTRMLNVEVLIGRDPEETGLTAETLIDAWQAGDILPSLLGEIRAVSTRTQRIQGERVWVWQFGSKILLGG